MLRITKESEYAFLLLSALLDGCSSPQSATTLAQITGIALPMTGKVLKRLVRGGILRSVRGAHGGYCLHESPQNVSALDIVKAMEGLPELVDCAADDFDCALAEHCRISPFLQQLNDHIQQILASRTLSDMQTMDHNRRKNINKINNIVAT